MGWSSVGIWRRSMHSDSHLIGENSNRRVIYTTTGLFYFRGKVIIPSQGELWKKLLHEAFDTKIKGIQECCGHSNSWLNNFIGLKCIKKSTNTSNAVKYVKRWNPRHSHLQDFSDHCPFHAKYRIISLSTSLNDCPLPITRTQYW
jgi:hypothetical protein